MVTVEVGRTNEIFDVHENLLLRHSDFFKAALSGGWRERDERKVTLSEEKTEIFEIFSRFIYSGSIFSHKEGDEYWANEKSLSHEWKRLQDCWNLGEKLQSTSFKDAIVDAIVAEYRTQLKVPLDIHNRIYASSHKKSKIRILLVDFAIHGWKLSAFENLQQDRRQPDFIFDVAAALLKIKKRGVNTKPAYLGDETCTYHVHEAEGKACYKTMF